MAKKQTRKDSDAHTPRTETPLAATGALATYHVTDPLCPDATRCDGADAWAARAYEHPRSVAAHTRRKPVLGARSCRALAAHEALLDLWNDNLPAARAKAHGRSIQE
ncbi:hypothetical protein BC830DRAFT_1151457, partial [Chytriomyces sp. MP71]